jgi:hypothetical protein
MTQLDEEWGSAYLEACKAALEGCLGLGGERPAGIEFTLAVNDDDSPVLEIMLALTDRPTRVRAFGWDDDDGWHYTLAPAPRGHVRGRVGEHGPARLRRSS